MKSQISPFEQISCCSHFFLTLGTQFVKALCRSTYSGVHVPRSLSDRKIQEFNSLSYIFFWVFTLHADCSFKFYLKALQGCSNAITLCVREREREREKDRERERSTNNAHWVLWGSSWWDMQWPKGELFRPGRGASRCTAFIRLEVDGWSVFNFVKQCNTVEGEVSPSPYHPIKASRELMEMM